jgi:hypothetical protein
MINQSSRIDWLKFNEYLNLKQIDQSIRYRTGDNVVQPLTIFHNIVQINIIECNAIQYSLLSLMESNSNEINIL